MIYKNNLVKNKVKKIKLRLDEMFKPVVVSKDENLLEKGQPVEKYNFFTADGSLKNGYGIQDLKLKNSQNVDCTVKISNDEVVGIWSTRWATNSNSSVLDFLFYMIDGGTVYNVDLSAPNVSLAMENTFSSVPTMTKVRQNSLEAFAFTSSSGMVLLTQSAETLYASAPKIMDACYHYNKMFAITAETRNALIYSAQLDVTAWTSSNTYRIDFTDDRGRLIKIMSYNDHLYVFREFGITKVSPYSVANDFSIEHIYQSNNCIYPETISICGDNVIFLTRDGLYSFNGTKVQKLDFDIVNKIEKTSSSSPNGIGFNGKYFLDCKIQYKDGTIGCEGETNFVNNSVVIFDLKNNEIEVMRGVDIKKFAELNSDKLNHLCAIFRGQNKHKIGQFIEGGSIFSNIFKNVWQTSFSDLGYTGKLKHVDEVKLISKENSTLVIKTDEETKTYNIVGSTKVQRVKTNVKGKLLSFKIESNLSGQRISKPEISLTVYMWNWHKNILRLLLEKQSLQKRRNISWKIFYPLVLRKKINGYLEGNYQRGGEQWNLCNFICRTLLLSTQG